MSATADGLILRVLNLAVAALLITAASLAIAQGGVSTIIVASYVITFSVIIIGLELYSPQFMYVQCRFLYSFFGRGLVYLFLGSIVLHDSVGVRLFCGVVSIVVGVMYLIFQFVPKLKPPPHGGLTGKNSKTEKSSSETIALEAGAH